MGNLFQKVVPLNQLNFLRSIDTQDWPQHPGSLLQGVSLKARANTSQCGFERMDDPVLHGSCFWPIATFRGSQQFGRFRSAADISLRFAEPEL
jgi:hypothetical protein